MKPELAKKQPKILNVWCRISSFNCLILCAIFLWNCSGGILNPKIHCQPASAQPTKPSIAMQSSLIPSPPQNQHALKLMTKRFRAFNVTSISEADPRLDWKEDALHTPQVTRPPHQHGMMSWKLKASTQTDGPYYENMDDFNVNVGAARKENKIPHLPCQLEDDLKLTPN